MRLGQRVHVTIDAVPDRQLHGILNSVSPASGARFAQLPPDNSTGNFNNVVQCIPVKIVLDAENLRQVGDRLSLGLSAVVSVRVR
jgi:membrane fusion protein (multidrug efflux system)